MSQFSRKFLRPAGDVILLLGALSAANLLIGRSDPGWLEINPAPFLAVPVLIGARYGFLTGLAAGLITVAAILGGRFGLIGERPITTWGIYPFALAAFPVLGALSGELRRLYASKMRSLEHANRRFRTEGARLELEVDLLRESNRGLRHEAALHGAELAAMDVELRDILSSGDAGIFGNTLDFLRRAAGVEEAAIFHRRGRGWSHVASSNNDSGALKLCDFGREMAERACEKNDLVTWAGLWDSQNGGSDDAADPVGNWLAALPWAAPVSDGPRAVLMVRTMPLRFATWDNFARIATICRWVAGLAIARLTDTGALAAAKPVKVGQFLQLLQLATETGSDHKLPSALLALQPATGENAAQSDADAAAEIAAALRPTDVFTKSHVGGKTHFGVLLPLAGQRDAEDILTRLKQVSGRVIPIDGRAPSDDIWGDLTKGNLDVSDKSHPSGDPSLPKGDPSAEPV